jgi:hypothetical protein
VGDVKLLSRWDGWCDPCGTERPLLLTARGEFGPRAWLSGVGMEDRTLVLTCGVCGEWQLCPWDEEFPPETVAYVEAGPEVVESTQAVVETRRRIFARSKPAPEITDPEITEPDIANLEIADQELPVPAEPAIVELPPMTADATADSAEEPAATTTRRPSVRVEAVIPEIVDAELLRARARAEARAERAAAAHAAAASAAAEQPTAEQPTAEQPTAEQPTAEQPTAEQPTAENAYPTEPARTAAPHAKRRTSPLRHIVLQTASGPAAAAAVPALPSPRAASPEDQDQALHLLAEGLDLIASAGR